MSTDNINKVIGENVRRVRGEMKQEVASEHIGIDQPTLSRKESGKSAFKIKELYALAELFECDIAALLPPMESDEWAPEGQEAAFFKGAAPDELNVARATILAMREARERAEKIHGRKAE